jgi:glucosamine-6-phosphate deaminase
LRLHVEISVELAVQRAGDVIAQAVQGRRHASTLALPTGRTMVPLYRDLARRVTSGRLDLSGARTFNLDELVLPLPHPASFASYMLEHAWSPLGIDASRRDIPRPHSTASADLAAECARYDAAVAAAGPFDLAVVGVGADGHVAYNLPGQVAEETHVVTLPDPIADAAGIARAERPLRAITLGMGPLRASRRLLMLATSTDKAAAVRALIDGPEADRWPCSLLRRHRDFDLVVTSELMEASGTSYRALTTDPAEGGNFGSETR